MQLQTTPKKTMDCEYFAVTAKQHSFFIVLTKHKILYHVSIVSHSIMYKWHLDLIKMVFCFIYFTLHKSKHMEYWT